MTIQQPDLSAFHAMMAGDVARTNFLAFVAGIFDVLHRSRGIRFLNNWHVEAMCHQLERVANGDVSAVRAHRQFPTRVGSGLGAHRRAQSAVPLPLASLLSSWSMPAQLTSGRPR